MILSIETNRIAVKCAEPWSLTEPEPGRMMESMKILVTGGFGSIGLEVVGECLRRGHEVTVFEVPSRRSKRLARRHAMRGVRTLFGDIRRPGDIVQAVEGRDAVIHMAAVLPPVSDAKPGLCREVNAGGTSNLIAAMRAAHSRSPALVLVSSASVMGPTQHLSPPVLPGREPAPTDAYSRSKAEAEAFVAASGLRHCILRLAAVMPSSLDIPRLLSMVKVAFDIPLGARCEIVVDQDAAYALVAAAENLAGSGGMEGRIGFIAGGSAQGCRMTTHDMLAASFAPLGLPLPRARLFPTDLDSYYLDWYETTDIASILGYQRHSAAQWRKVMAREGRFLHLAARIFRGPAMAWLERQSPRFGA